MTRTNWTIAFIVLTSLLIFYLLVVLSPAERFGAGGRLGSASSDNGYHYMRSESLNKMQKYRV